MWVGLRTWLPAVVPRGLKAGDASVLLPKEPIVLHGIALNLDAQLARLPSWEAAHQRLFAAILDDSAINPLGRPQGRVHNGWFETPDAEIYVAVIADSRPHRIVEVGGGYSTLIARRTVDELGLSCSITVVDPEPRTEVRDAVDSIHLTMIEDFDADRLELGSGPVLLFIDSSHVVRSGGDVPLLFDRIIPQLAPGSMVHVHDIFLPYDYPPALKARLYTEQYVLQALLTHSNRYEVQFATHCMARQFTHEMQRSIRPTVASDHRFYGSSFWFRVR